MNKKIIENLKAKGVIFIDEESVYIDNSVIVENNVKIYPNNNIYGNTVIKSGTVLEPNNIIFDSKIGKNTIVTASVLKKAEIGDNVTVGPNAYLRPDSIIGDNCRIGDFVEIKNSKIGNGTKISHLTYIGDSVVGKTCNFGCGVITANYDGKNKYKTEIGDNCFIGSNCNLIAPVKVGNNSFIAAGTTITKEVKESKFVIGRVRQEENENLAKKYIK